MIVVFSSGVRPLAHIMFRGYVDKAVTLSRCGTIAEAAVGPRSLPKQEGIGLTSDKKCVCCACLACVEKHIGNLSQ